MSTTAIVKSTDLDLAVAEAAQAYEVATADKTANIASALAAADAIESLRAMFTPPIVAKLRQLCGKSLGFRTDRDQKGPPYPDNVLVECALEAGLRGLPFVADCWNIISSRVYVTKGGLKTLIKRMTEVSNFTYTVGLPKRVGDGIVSDCTASWTQASVKRELELQIPMRADGASIDNIVGRLERRLLARCYEQMTNRAVAEDLDLEPETAGLATTTPKFLTVAETPTEDQLAGTQAIAPAPQPPTPEPKPTPPPAPKPTSVRPMTFHGEPGKPWPPPAPPVVETEVVPPAAAAPAPRRGPGRPPKVAQTAEPPRQTDLSSLGATRVERPAALTLPQIRQVMADCALEETELLAFLRKKHGLQQELHSLEQLALERLPLYRWVSENIQTAVDQTTAARA
jgi:hypothetical protein